MFNVYILKIGTVLEKLQTNSKLTQAKLLSPLQSSSKTRHKIRANGKRHILDGIFRVYDFTERECVSSTHASYV